MEKKGFLSGMSKWHWVAIGSGIAAIAAGGLGYYFYTKKPAKPIEAAKKHEGAFNYKDHGRNWSELCAIGKAQSPIDFPEPDKIVYEPAISIKSEHKPIDSQLKATHGTAMVITFFGPQFMDLNNQNQSLLG